jgi:hypothetical protein
MTRASASPKITHLSWGRIEVEGRDSPFKDAKLYPGGAREWDWGETGTSHVPGIQPSDVEELLENGASVVVLSRGMQRRLQVAAETVSMLDERGVEAHVLPTDEAMAKYNELARKERVGGLFHSTC